MFKIKQIYRSEKGFTLFEMIIVLSALTILSTIGIASFSSGSKAASVDTALNDIVSTFHLARSRAISQVKPQDSGICNGALRGYKVDIDINNRSYSLVLVCENNINVISTKILPSNITFNGNTTQTSFFFPVLTGSVEGSGKVSISGYNKNKTIIVDTVGGITIKNE